MLQSLSCEPEQTRVCSRCNIEKPLTSEHFQADRQKPSGYRPDCKACRHAIYARENAGARRVRNRQLLACGLKTCASCGVDLPIDQFMRASRNADGLAGSCKPCVAAAVKARREANPERFDAPAKAYKKRNIETVRERARKYAAQRRKNDPTFKFRGAVTRLVGFYLKRKGGNKRGSPFFKAVDYTPDDLRRHIEKQFTQGMSWANYGEWHLEHIIPNATFDYTCMEDAEFRACWALTNLRPMWKLENLKKSDAVLSLL